MAIAILTSRLDTVDVSTNGPPSPGGHPRRGIALALEVALTGYAAAVFVVLWLYVAAAAFTDGTLLADTWAWLGGLDTIAAIVVWVAILPVAVFTWAWQADLEPLWTGALMLGIVAWTAIAFSGLLRTVGRLLARRSA
jgi:hypothetical protein